VIQKLSSGIDGTILGIAKCNNLAKGYTATSHQHYRIRETVVRM
jgi:hypothetical protein